MKNFIFICCYLSLLCIGHKISAQTLIKGIVKDFANQQSIDNVNIRNIYSMQGMTTKADGNFEVVVKKGELIEISKVGYETVRIRIQHEKEPSFYAIELSRKPVMLREVDVKGKPIDFKRDSLKFRETYDIIMRKPTLDEIDMRSMPLAMLSKKNRQEWAFQEMYRQWEHEKYIDFVFNDKLIQRITYLEGDDLTEFKSTYKPTYEFLRSATEYEFLDYIKRSYFDFKRKHHP